MSFPIFHSLTEKAEPIRDKKTPLIQQSGVLFVLYQNYLLFPRLDALRGLSLVLTSTGVFTTWVARLQLPFFHFKDGSGYDVQYQAEEYSVLRLHPLHFSTISWHIPPLYEHPLADMKGHSLLFLTVVQTIFVTTFLKS